MLTTGSKQELAERVADAQILGSIPECKMCGAGNIVFNSETGQYKCEGFTDGETKIDCGILY
jgi:hypothetical protein